MVIFITTICSATSKWIKSSDQNVWTLILILVRLPENGNIGKKTFQNFLTTRNREGLDKLGVLPYYLSPKIYQYIEDCVNYPTAIATLQTLYIKPTNKVFSRHLLATRHQQPAETLDEHFQALKALSKDCNYKNVTAVLYHEESIRDAFITGLTSGLTRQRLLENKSLDLKTMFD